MIKTNRPAAKLVFPFADDAAPVHGADSKEHSMEKDDMNVSVEAIKKTVEALAEFGIDGKIIAMALSAAATHELVSAYGKEGAGKLAAQMYMRSYPA